MNLSGLGSFTTGMNEGLSMQAKIAALRQAQNQRRASSAVGQMLLAGAVPSGAMPGGMDDGMGGGDMPQPPMPGVASLPRDGAPPLPGAAPQMMPGQLPESSMDLAAGMDPTEMGSFDSAPMLPAPASTPQMPPQPTGAGGDPLSGAAAGTGNVQHDAESTILNIARQLKAANPDITAEQMFDAVNLHIEQMKGVRNDVKDYMTAQVEVLKAQTRLQQTQMRVEGQENVAGINAGGRVDAATIRGDAARDVANITGNSRENVAGINAHSREAVAGMLADNRIAVAEIAANSREVIAATGADAKMYASKQAYRARVNAAALQMGVTPIAGPPPATPAPRTGTPAPTPSGAPAAPARAPAAPAATRYKSADDVKAAYQAGKISRESATQILRTQFGMK